MYYLFWLFFYAFIIRMFDNVFNQVFAMGKNVKNHHELDENIAYSCCCSNCFDVISYFCEL